VSADGADAVEDEVLTKTADIQDAIAEGANSFLATEYKMVAYFAVGYACVIFILLATIEPGTNFDNTQRTKADEVKMAGFTTIAFIVGAATSALCGFIGMRIAVYANARTALEARKGIAPAFMLAFRAGSVMGFSLSGLGLLSLWIVIKIFGPAFKGDWLTLYETITGFGLGGSAIALFGRVGGGIYTKAADVGADLVGKVEKDIPEDDPRNPAVIADNVGDNVGDIAGMGADLFGSFAESTVAALVVAAASSLGTDHNWTAMSFPLLITAFSILVCAATTLLATDFRPATTIPEIEPALKMQLIVSTVLMTPVAAGIAMVALPNEFTLVFPSSVAGELFSVKVVKNVHIFLCVLTGLWSGLIIGLQTEYFTSNTYEPVREVADACKTGSATNVIFGLALGYKSAILPTIVLCFDIFIAGKLAGMYGIAICALGFLGTLATGLAIDAYGPISDNAGGVAEMAGMGKEIRERTDALDAAGNTTAAIGKGFAIGSAALVSLALFGAYVTRAKIDLSNTSILDPAVYVGLFFGAMLPYWFSAMTMKSVGKAALAMVEEVRRQFREIPGLMEGTGRPDYKRCVEISTVSSLREMVAPGVLVMLTPLVVGVLFGTRCLAGMLAGILVSGVQLAVSMSNTGGAWDNAKKYIEAGASEHAASFGGKGSEAHKAAVTGDTVGDPLKDTSGPSLNILIKLMAVESLVFAPFFYNIAKGHGLIFQYFKL